MLRVNVRRRLLSVLSGLYAMRLGIKGSGSIIDFWILLFWVWTALVLVEPFIANWKLCVFYLQVYIRLHDKPLADSDAQDDIDTANLTPKELKKLRSKQRRAQKKAQQQKEEEERNKAHEKQGKNKHDPDLDGPKEEELVPEKLARVSGFLFV